MPMEEVGGIWRIVHVLQLSTDSSFWLGLCVGVNFMVPFVVPVLMLAELYFGPQLSFVDNEFD